MEIKVYSMGNSRWWNSRPQLIDIPIKIGGSKDLILDLNLFSSWCTSLVSIWHVLIVFRVLLMLPSWGLNQVLRGCNKFQRTPGEFIAFHWVHFTIWSNSIGRRFESKSCSSPYRYGSRGDRTHRRSKSCWPGLREIRSPVASSRCINSEIALPTISLDDVVLSPWTRTLIRCPLFPTSVKCECLFMGVTPSNVQFQQKMTCWSQLPSFWINRLLKGTHLRQYCAGREAGSSFCCTVY
jgi:hypothetical protein